MRQFPVLLSAIFGLCASCGGDASGPGQPALQPPAAPSGLVAAGVSANTATLAWSDNSANETEFRLERKGGSAASWIEVASRAASVTSHTDYGLAPSTAYSYRVRACNAAGCSAYSAEAALTTEAPPVLIPAAPAGLAATAVSAVATSLTWSDASSDETEFRLERRSGAAGAWAQIATTAANTTSYSDTGLAEGTEYGYRLRACNSAGCSAYTAEASAVTPFLAPAQPTELRLLGITNGQITLMFVDQSPVESHFQLERRVGAGGAWSMVRQWSHASPSFVGNAAAFDTTGVINTSYDYRVRACRSTSCSPYTNEATSVHTGDLVSVPADVRADAASPTAVRITWSAPAVAHAAHRLERRIGAEGAWTGIALPAWDQAGFDDTGLTPGGGYAYRLRGCNTLGFCVGYSAEASVTTPAVPVIPAAPSGLAASAASQTEITLTWHDNSANETEFRLERRSGGSAWAELVTFIANVVGHNDTGLAPGTEYSYRVRACNSAGCSAYATETSATTLAPPEPAPPSALAASATSPSAIALTWSDNSTNETEFRLERRSGGGAWAEVVALAAGVAGHNDTGLAASTTYSYRVRACNSAGCSAYSAEASATTPAPPPPAPPASLAASATSASAITLTWSDESVDETEFRLERRSGDSDWAAIVTLGSGVVSHNDTGLAASTRYVYRVRACNNAGCSAYSAEAAATTPAPATIPAAPSFWDVTSASQTSIDLVWHDKSSDETEFRIERQLGGWGAWAQIVTTAANATTYSDTGLEPGTWYGYRIRACNSAGCSAYSEVAGAATLLPSLPAAPSDVVVTDVTADAMVSIAWRDNSDNETSFRVGHFNNYGDWQILANVPANTTTAAFMVPGRYQGFSVRACNAAGCAGDAYSPWVITPPGNLRAYAWARRVSLAWSADSTTTNVVLERRTAASAWTTVAYANYTSSPPTYPHHDDGLQPDTEYFYRAMACAKSGTPCSIYTPEVSVRTLAVPPSPTHLTASRYMESITLAWDYAGAYPAHFLVQRYADDMTTIASSVKVAATARSWTSSNLIEGRYYRYRVSACGSDTSCSDPVEGTFSTYPAAPSGLVATPQSKSEIALYWTNVSANATQIQVQRLVGGSEWVTVNTTWPSMTSFWVTGLSPSSTYSFRVRACTGADTCSTSNVASTTTPAF